MSIDNSNRNAYQPGNHYIICDVCGFKLHASATRKRWDGLRVCTQDWEPRHPQDFVKGKRDRQVATDARPEAADVFLAPNQITVSNL